MKTQTKLFILGIVLVVGLAIFFMNRPEDNITPNIQTTSEQTVQPQEEKPTGLARTDIAAQATREGRYTIVGDKVYNVISWIAQHPGGAEKTARQHSVGNIPVLKSTGYTHIILYRKCN